MRAKKCDSAQLHKTAKYKRSTILPKGILNVSKNGQKCPLSDIYMDIYIPFESSLYDIFFYAAIT
jgi:hypothetical protein